MLSVKSDDQEARSLVKMELENKTELLPFLRKPCCCQILVSGAKGWGVRGWGLALAFCLEKQFDEHSLLSGPVVFSTVRDVQGAP